MATQTEVEYKVGDTIAAFKGRFSRPETIIKVTPKRIHTSKFDVYDKATRRGVCGTPGFFRVATDLHKAEWERRRLESEARARKADEREKQREDARLAWLANKALELGISVSDARDLCEDYSSRVNFGSFEDDA